MFSLIALFLFSRKPVYTASIPAAAIAPANDREPGTTALAA